MVTFEQLLIKYIYQHKKVSLQGFGTVVLNAAIPDYDLIHKNKHLPIEGVTFEYDPKASTDVKFIEFFAQHRGKIKPLAISDIESHLQLARQLMNIGKPYEVEGLGMFSLDKNGGILFASGNFAVPLTESQSQHNRLKERTEVQEKIESETTRSTIDNGTKRAMITVATILILGVIGWWVWSKFIANHTPAAENTVIASDSLDALENTLAVPDEASTSALPDAAADSNSVIKWKAYFRTFDTKERAMDRLKFYESIQNPVVLETSDSVNFKMYVIIESPVSDTARKIDSLKKFYARPVTFEKLNP